LINRDKQIQFRKKLASSKTTMKKIKTAKKEIQDMHLGEAETRLV